MANLEPVLPETGKPCKIEKVFTARRDGQLSTRSQLQSTKESSTPLAEIAVPSQPKPVPPDLSCTTSTYICYKCVQLPRCNAQDLSAYLFSCRIGRQSSYL